METLTIVQEVVLNINRHDSLPSCNICRTLSHRICKDWYWSREGRGYKAAHQQRTIHVRFRDSADRYAERYTSQQMRYGEAQKYDNNQSMHILHRAFLINFHQDAESRANYHLDLPMEVMTLPRRLRTKLLLTAVGQKRKLKHYISVLKSSL